MKTEEEILKLAQIFDDIIGSDSRAVQEAFQRLTLLATMAKPDNEHFEQGPFARMITGIQVMEQEIKSLRRSVQILENSHPNDTFKIDVDNIGIDLSQYSSSMPHVAPLTISQIETITLTDINMTSPSGAAFSGLDTITIGDYNSWSLNDKK